jgi:hypothetical protein
MKSPPVFLCILLLLTVSVTGCTTPVSPAAGTGGNPVRTPLIPPQSAGHPEIFTPLPFTSVNAAVNTSAIPLLLTDEDWKYAEECGWTPDNLSESAGILMDDCEVRNLTGDGWEIAGIGYDMNVLGSRCRMSTHPGVDDTCDWCLDAGPTLTLRYRSTMTTSFRANLQTKTVTRFRAELPEGTGSVFTGDSERILFRNGTVLYTFRHC